MEVINSICGVLGLAVNTAIIIGWVKTKNKKFSFITLLLALVFAACMVVSHYLLYDFISSIKVMAVLGVVYTMYCYIIVDTIYHYFDKYNFEEHREVSYSKKFMLIMAAILLLWSPVILASFPGNITYDTGTSIIYSLGIDRSNVNNPFFQNFLFGSIYRIGEFIGSVHLSIFLYCFLQTLGFAACIAKGLLLLLENGCSKKLTCLIGLLYGCVPIFPLYAFCMGKDSSFALFIFVFSLQLFDLVKNPEVFFGKPHKVVFITVVAVMLGLLRNSMYIISVVSLVFCIVFSLKRKGVAKNIAIITAIVLVVNIGLPKLLNTPEGTIGELLSVPIQQTGYYVAHFEDEITAEERENIEKVIPFDALYQYNPYISDPVKDRFNNEASSEELGNYFKTWFEQFKKHPEAYVKATLLGTCGYYFPDMDKSNVKPHSFVGYWVDGRLFENTEMKPNENKLLDELATYDKLFTQTPFLGLFAKIGIYTWFLIMAAMYALTRNRIRYIACLMPAALVFAQCIISPVNGYFRYAFPMIVTVPIICVLVMCVKKHKESSTTDEGR